ncbi:unnamed protein product [Rotaria socialis]|uniref:B box-type domain-containing protein n=2 Tax=Rotaria socialis TaxID=392032 RepID=A0A818F4R9_9BILA|nr:unnamed protein product [Rotaria socialis]
MQRDKIKSTIETFRSISNKGILQNTNHMSRDKPTVSLFSPKSSTITQTIKCGQCVTEEAKMKCIECVENYCANCFTYFHLRGALQRHHRIFLSENQLSISQRKNRSFNSDLNLRDLTHRQSNDGLHRKSTMTLNVHESEELHNLKTNSTSFQKAFSKWRNKNVNGSKAIRSKNGFITSINETISDRMDYSNRLPNIESNSSRLSSNEKIRSKRDRPIEKNNLKKSNQQSKKTKDTKKDKPKIGVMINIYYALTENTNLNDPSIDIESFDEDIEEIQTEKSVQAINTEEQSNNENTLEHVEEQERPVTHISSKSYLDSTSPSMKKNSMTLCEKSLHSLLSTKSTDELETIVYSELFLSHSLLSSIDGYDEPSNFSNQNRIPDDKTSLSTIVDHYPVAHFDSSLNDLSYESKIESSNHFNQLSKPDSPIRTEKDPTPTTDRLPINTSKNTQRRNSPFSFTNRTSDLHGGNSSSSIGTNDDCFFTDMLPRQKNSSHRILSPSKSNYEQADISENQTTINSPSIPTKSPITSAVRKDSKHSIKIEQSPCQSKSATSRPASSSSSSSSTSLPISVMSSKSDFIYPNSQSSAKSSRKSSSSSISTTKSSSPAKTKMSSSTTTKSSSPAKTKMPSSTTTKSSSPAKTKMSSSTTTNRSSSITTKASSSTTTLASTKSSPVGSPSNNRSSSKPTINHSSLELETIPSKTAENLKVPLPLNNDTSIQDPIISLNDHHSSPVGTQQDLNDLVKPNSIRSQTADEIINENHSPMKEKNPHRQLTHSEELSKFRKLEFSMEDGLKWQAASGESLSSTKTISSIQTLHTKSVQSFTPQPTNGTGRLTLMYETAKKNEKYFNCIHQEHYSTYTKNVNDDVNVNEHLLQILQDAELPLDEKSSPMIQTKSQENEIDDRPSTDREFFA